MSERAELEGYDTERVKWILTVGVFVLFSLFSTPVGGLVVAAIVYSVFDSWSTEGDAPDGEEGSVPWQTPGERGSTSSALRTVDGPSGEVLTLVPDGMSAFSKEYPVRVTSTRPVTVELQDTEAALRPIADAADRLGVPDSVLGRVNAEPPRVVADEAEWRIRNDLDQRLAENAPDGGFVVGDCTVEAASDFDGFRYSVDYSPEYVRSEGG